jgi:proteasome lid subunit RPN8/RPN11
MILFESTPLQKMKDHASLIFPDECCGFLFGKESKSGIRTVSKIFEVNNAKSGDKRRRFEIAPKDYIQAEQFAIDHDIQLLGIYHSHPNHPAIPSETDRISAQPWFSYLIISVLSGKIDQIRSWRLNDISQFEEENFLTNHSNLTI